MSVITHRGTHYYGYQANSGLDARLTPIIAQMLLPVISRETIGKCELFQSLVHRQDENADYGHWA